MNEGTACEANRPENAHYVLCALDNAGYQADTAEAMSDADRAALIAVIDAARRRWHADHADTPPVMRTIADAVLKRAAGQSMPPVAEQAGVQIRAVSCLLQQAADRLTVAELAALAGWAGLEIIAGPRGEASLAGLGHDRR
ncbi:hypothetical protein [Frankia sp. Cr1]|uniref:hypothetical protein n=1 Tax=Frankia sp. Cr1 TaxID=3073931 RepID=UPI002AD26A1E|nr:hypothetical protein [Frankia sp. Cr1]